MTERVVRLDSGLTVAIDEMASTRSASIGVWVGVGSRDEPNAASGVSHFLEHLLFKGTDRLTARDISRRVDRVGGDINAYTSKEHTVFHCRVPARHVADSIAILGDVICSPSLRADDVESERQVISEELAMDDDSPEDVAFREFSAALFANHPLGRDTAGERETVAAMTGEQIRQFHRERYLAGSMVISVAGGVDADSVIAMVEKAFTPVRSGRATTAREAPGSIDSGGHLDDDTEQVHLVLGGRAIPRGDADREALDIANHVLGGGLSSRLFDEIRERRGLAYSVFSSVSTFEDCGAWTIYAGSQPATAPAVRELIEVECSRLVDEGITEEELADAKGFLQGAFELGLEDSGARMSRLGGSLTLLGRLVPVDEQLARWAAVELDDVARVAERVFGGPRVAVSVGPSQSQ
ncbi:MAG: M16 family metallopeptidase [Ilumatobacteraceae bacterium]